MAHDDKNVVDLGAWLRRRHDHHRAEHGAHNLRPTGGRVPAWDLLADVDARRPS